MGKIVPPEQGKFCEEKERLFNEYDNASKRWAYLAGRLSELLRIGDPRIRAARMQETIDARDDTQIARLVYEAHKTEHGC
jgi:acyl-CoA reductase-like NAD-dependent aldehyde dehydrogenase